MEEASPLLWIPIFAFVLTVLLYGVGIKVYRKLGLLDFPERYGLKRERIPYPTGLIPVAVFVLALLVLSDLSLQSIGLMIGILILAISSFIDDRSPLPAILRLGIQILVAIIIFATGTYILSLTNPLEGILGLGDIVVLNQWHLEIGTITLPLLSGLFTIIWLGLTINALNWFDGIPGQVSTLSTIGFSTIGFLSMSDRVNQPELALLSFILAAIAFGCFFFDFGVPKALLGDTGSMFFGLMLGVITIFTGGKVATAFLVLGVPLIDSVFVVIQRLMKGKHPFKGSASGEHLHHRLLAKGWSNYQVIALTATLGTLFGITALFLSTREKFIAGLILLLIMGLLFIYSKPKK